MKVNVEEVISFNSLMEKIPEKTKRKYEGMEEPNTLEILYRGDPDGPMQAEIVFEDPSEVEKKPRLLVSLQSVLALKALCEREFGRVETLAAMLHKCRCAYFKELLWLREQLHLASRPEYAMIRDAIEAYEVYWFDPPQYVNEELREFMQDCIRHTNRKLIEENYELRMRLDGKSLSDYEDPNVTLRRILAKLGIKQLVKMMQATASSKDGSAEMVTDFQAAVLEIAHALGWRKPEKVVETKAGMDPKLMAELEDLREKVKDMEFLRKRFNDLQNDMDSVRKAKEEADRALQLEKERADAEKARADAERERAEKAEQAAKKDPNANRNQVDKKTFEMLRAAADRAADRVMACVGNLSRLKTFAGAAASPPSSPTANTGHLGLEQASTALEDLVSASSDGGNDDMVKALQKLQRATDQLQAKVKSLEQQLKEAQESEAKAKSDAEDALRRAEEAARRAGGDRIDMSGLNAAADAERAASKRAEKAERQVLELKKKLSEQEEEIASLKKEVARLTKLLEDSGKDTGEGELVAKQRAEMKELKKKLEELTDQCDMLLAKLARAQEKIRELKDEVKKWKAMCGVETNSDDEDDSDDDLPNFLLSYAKRNKLSTKPRYLMLSEDAVLGRMKREFTWGQKYAHTMGGSAIASAFKFLKIKPQGGMVIPAPTKAHSRDASPEGYWYYQPAGSPPPQFMEFAPPAPEGVPEMSGPSASPSASTPVKMNLPTSIAEMPTNRFQMTANTSTAAAASALSSALMPNRALHKQHLPQQLLPNQQPLQVMGRSSSPTPSQQSRSPSPMAQPPGRQLLPDAPLPPQILASAGAAAASAAGAAAAAARFGPQASGMSIATHAMSAHTAALNAGWGPQPMRVEGQNVTGVGKSAGSVGLGAGAGAGAGHGIGAAVASRLAAQQPPPPPSTAPFSAKPTAPLVVAAPQSLSSASQAVRPRGVLSPPRPQQSAAVSRDLPSAAPGGGGGSHASASWSLPAQSFSGPGATVTQPAGPLGGAISARALMEGHSRANSRSQERSLGPSIEFASSPLGSPTGASAAAPGASGSPSSAAAAVSGGRPVPAPLAGLSSSSPSRSSPSAGATAGAGTRSVDFGITGGSLSRTNKSRNLSEASTSWASGNMEAANLTSPSATSSVTRTPKPAYSMPFKVAAPAAPADNMRRTHSASFPRAQDAMSPASEGHIQMSMESPVISPSTSPNAKRRGPPPASWGRARSTASLPLTNGVAAMGATMGIGGRPGGGPTSPSKAQRAAAASNLEEFAFSPEALPPLPQRGIRKAQPPPSWLQMCTQ